MTTIATDGKSMAGDGLREMNQIVRALDTRKVHRLPDGSLLGISGAAQDCDAFRDWMAAGQEGARPRAKTLSALHLKADGQLEYFNERGAGVHAECPAAVGSGNELALGALLAGASAHEAVEIAAKRDPFTGGTITVLHLGEGK